jgi:hypothetical protein
VIGPSTACYNTAVDIYSGTKISGTAADPQRSYSSIPTWPAVPCTVQFVSSELDEAAQDRITQVNQYWVMYGGPQLPLKVQDKVLWTDSLGASHTLFVIAGTDEAGRGAAFTFSATEKI